MKCVICEGSGKLSALKKSSSQTKDKRSRFEWYPVDCSRCDGTGRRPLWPGLKEWWALKVWLKLYIWWDVHFSKD